MSIHEISLFCICIFLTNPRVPFLPRSQIRAERVYLVHQGRHVYFTIELEYVYKTYIVRLGC